MWKCSIFRNWTHETLISSSQVVLWINQSFLLLEEVEAKNGLLDVAFQSLRTQTPLVIKMQQDGNVSREVS